MREICPADNWDLLLHALLLAQVHGSLRVAELAGLRMSPRGGAKSKARLLEGGTE